MMQVLNSREEWLKARAGSIGGSDAAAVLGLSPHMTNVELWEIKTGRREPKDLSDVPVVAYGTKAEEYLRNLFRLDFPEYVVMYEPNNFVTNGLYPGCHVSLDGRLYDQDGRLGVLEIKTAEIQSAAQKKKWDDGIPQHYYIQLLHEMLITGAEFAVLCAQLKWTRDGDVLKVTKHYKLEQKDVEPDMQILTDAETKFVKCIKHDTPPDLILTAI